MKCKTVILTPPKDFLIKNVIIEGVVYKNHDLEIDECIAKEIQELWAQGIHTLGCCCGHGKKGFIQVERTDFAKMLELGYEWYTDYPEDMGGKDRLDAFIPKSMCNHIIEEKKEKNEPTIIEPLSVYYVTKTKRKEIGKAHSRKEVEDVIQQFLDENNYKAKYWKVNFYPEYLEYDVGSWTDFFRVYDNGAFRTQE